MSNRWQAILLAAALALSGVAAAGDAPELEFSDAWVRALPPGMGMTAGFGSLHNSGARELQLVAYSSPQFASVSLHRTETVDGVSRMREVPELRLGAGETLELAPGGYHLMLMKPRGGVHAGEQVTVVMQAADGAAFEFELPVERR